MKELKEIYKLLDDASTAILIYQNAFTIKDKELFYELKTNDNEAPFYIDLAYELVKEYNIRNSVDSDEIEEAENSSLVAFGWIKYDSEDMENMLEDLLFQFDREQRYAVIKKIIRRSKKILSLNDNEFRSIACMCGFISYGSKERYIEIEGVDKFSFDELSNIIASLVIVATQFLSHVSTNCDYFEIGEIGTLINQIFPDEYETMNMNLFSEEAKTSSSIPIFSYGSLLIDNIYRKCNGYLWDDISKEEFIILLNSSGKGKSLTIKKNQINRTKFVFRMIAKSINKDKRNIWVEGIMKHIFDNVEFMKATLRTDKLSSGYSDEDVKFSQLIKDL